MAQEKTAPFSDFALGYVTDGEGRPLANEAYITFDHQEDGDSGEIEIRARNADKVAAFIVRAVKSHEALVAALPSPDKLDLLATWFEKYDADVGLHGSEVQDDLRAWAKNIRAALALAKSE